MKKKVVPILIGISVLVLATLSGAGAVGWVTFIPIVRGGYPGGPYTEPGFTPGPPPCIPNPYPPPECFMPYNPYPPPPDTPTPSATSTLTTTPTPVYKYIYLPLIRFFPIDWFLR